MNYVSNLLTFLLLTVINDIFPYNNLIVFASFINIKKIRLD